MYAIWMNNFTSCQDNMYSVQYQNQLTPELNERQLTASANP